MTFRKGDTVQVINSGGNSILLESAKIEEIFSRGEVLVSGQGGSLIVVCWTQLRHEGGALEEVCASFSL